MNEEEKKYYVVRTHCYGKRPHDNYIVTTAKGENVIIEDPTLATLQEAINGEDYIPQTEVSLVMDALAETGGISQTDEDRTAFAKAMLIREIDAYDDSPAVNSFTVAGQSLWFTPEKRATIEKGVKNCQTLGRDTYDAWLPQLGMQVSIPCDTALMLLAQVEVYALDCANVTARHQSEVQALTTEAEVVAYDYTADYPTHLTFSL